MTGDVPDHAALCAALAAGDDSIELLAIARAAIDARLATLAARPRLTSAGVRALSEAPTQRQIAADGSDRAATTAGARFLIPWLAGEGVELRRISQAADADRESHALLFGLYARCYGPGGWSDELRQLAGWAAFPEPLGTYGDREGAFGALHEALFLRLCLSCFPGRLFPEILGYALAELDSVGAWCDRTKAVLGRGYGAYDRLAARADHLYAERPVVSAAVKCARRSLHGADKAAFRARIACGIALYHALTTQVWRSFEVYVDTPADALAVLSQVLRRKAVFAVGYHPHVMLAGRSLDAWFAEYPFRADAFLSALTASQWVDREVPGQSPLLKLFQFGGPMYGILAPDELAALRAWLEGVSRTDLPSQVHAAVNGVPATMPARSGAERPRASPGRPDRSQSATPGGRASGRALFHALVNVEEQPEALSAAQRYVTRNLRRVACDVGHRWRRFPYAEATFETWVGGVYRGQLAAVQYNGATPKLSRAAYVFGIEQLAPAILVDGCWLQRVDTLAAVSPPVARRLAAIYADELGNGAITHNHAWIYRRLLDSLGLECLPVESAAFAANPRLLDSAFDLPALLLSISVHTHRFLPELLGLNLAIEISGLGSVYGQAARDLEYWGIDAQIVRLHQSIDNLASGHAALAKEAIMLHLRQIRGLGGEVAVQRHWRRVQQGYDLLRVVTRAFKRRLVGVYLARSAAARLRDWAVGVDAGYV